jgi:hypothetical protein
MWHTKTPLSRPFPVAVALFVLSVAAAAVCAQCPVWGQLVVVDLAVHWAFAACDNAISNEISVRLVFVIVPFVYMYG